MFDNFDPLSVSENQQTDKAIILKRTKRNIKSILHSYVGWYDPFAELLQNALDSVEKRARIESFEKKISIIIDEKSNCCTVSDNGTGLERSSFIKFLAPHESFKEDGERGSKGVGATYLAYGFNYIRIDTKTKHFSANGEMENARLWLYDSNASSNPEVYPTESEHIDSEFNEFDTGVSITLKFDEKTKPSQLSWPQLNSAKLWLMALSVKTAIGAVAYTTDVQIRLTLKKRDGENDTYEADKTQYSSPHLHMKKTAEYGAVIKKIDQNVKDNGAAARLPISIRNLDAIWLSWDQHEIIKYIDGISQEEIEFCKKHEVKLIASLMYTAKIWKRLADEIFNYRTNAKIYDSGIQLAADNMPQGDLIQIPLNRFQDRRYRAHVVIHFENCEVDLGRKGFDKHFAEFAKSISAKLLGKNYTRIRDCLRNGDVGKKDLLLGDKVDDWKKQLETHEEESPLLLSNKHFFVPVNEISISSEPSREQDVIALFNQLVAGGVIRGIKVVGTNERSTYDGAFRVKIGPNFDHHVFDKNKNPLGISGEHASEIREEFQDGYLSNKMHVLEYKYTLDGLISDLGTGEKKASDIDLVITWQAGTDYSRQYRLTSLLNNAGSEDRHYHGITHILTDEFGNRVMDVILLDDLIGYLNNPEAEQERQNLYQ